MRIAKDFLHELIALFQKENAEPCGLGSQRE